MRGFSRRMQALLVIGLLALLLCVLTACGGAASSTPTGSTNTTSQNTGSTQVTPTATSSDPATQVNDGDQKVQDILGSLDGTKNDVATATSTKNSEDENQVP
ncbi:hypothetical protein [Tengunoibacter tsumagoiensis]|uniref:Uncharacterized protein n=1 Tax=Tengunoibacter tsumagoiensis TaxID=2014871 RepID=A0A401ZX59_9CHLR|nr:hypothetical protein [Tengunoibacter tsumagoiensis]GCE11427.1 hypothetical protein KTT_12860 [Tengunoibacter tsumagoiensis]